MEADFKALLSAHASLTALVSNRIYPTTYPQAAVSPAIRYTKISGQIGLHMQGSDGLSDTLMQVDVRASTFASLMSVRNALVGLLHHYRGIVGATDFRLISLATDRGARFEKPDAVEYHTTSLDFSIWSRSA